MIRGQVIVELLVNGPLYNFGNRRNNGNWPKVGWVGWVAGFVDGKDEGMLPGYWDFGERNAGVDQIWRRGVFCMVRCCLLGIFTLSIRASANMLSVEATVPAVVASCPMTGFCSSNRKKKRRSSPKRTLGIGILQH